MQMSSLPASHHYCILFVGHGSWASIDLPKMLGNAYHCVMCLFLEMRHMTYTKSFRHILCSWIQYRAEGGSLS